jgi:hypothetical protein
MPEQISENSSPSIENRSENNNLSEPVQQEFKSESENFQAEIADFENNHFVKIAPKIQEQVRDKSRNNEITYVSVNDGKAHDYRRLSDFPEGDYREINEREAIKNLGRVFASAIKREGANDVEKGRQLQEKSAEMLNTMTFIGEKEMTEATSFFAKVIRQKLTVDPSKMIYIDTISDIGNDNNLENTDDNIGLERKGYVKSDKYILDKILSNFDEYDKEAFSSRLITSEEKLSQAINEGLSMDVIILDDWTVSEWTLRVREERLLDLQKRLPDIDSHKDRWLFDIVTWLVAATPSQIDSNSNIKSRRRMTDTYTYYMAPVDKLERINEPDNKTVGNLPIITGAHSSVDYTFSHRIAGADFAPNGVEQPALANVVRPYNKRGEKYILDNILWWNKD